MGRRNLEDENLEDENLEDENLEDENLEDVKEDADLRSSKGRSGLYSARWYSSPGSNQKVLSMARDFKRICSRINLKSLVQPHNRLIAPEFCIES